MPTPPVCSGSFQPVLRAEGEGKGSKPAANNSMVNAIALFNKGGELIYMGQSKGTITVLDAATLKFLDFVKVLTLSSAPALQSHSQACLLVRVIAVAQMMLGLCRRNRVFASQ